MEERDRVAVAAGRAHEDLRRSRLARVLHDPLDERAPDAPTTVGVRDDERLEFRAAAVPEQPRVADDAAVVVRDEHAAVHGELAADAAVGIESAVGLDELLEQRAARLSVPRLVLANDHRATLNSAA